MRKFLGVVGVVAIALGLISLYASLCFPGPVPWELSVARKLSLSFALIIFGGMIVIFIDLLDDYALKQRYYHRLNL